ncbi:MAG: tRNA epoxyqueuosine(34) reductase QueG [Pseudomonadota bacterium]
MARKLGFDAVGFAGADLPNATAERLKAFLDQGRHGTMQWMETRADQRSHPQNLWPDARSVVMLGVNYGPERDPLEILKKKSAGAISVYAHNKDYHDVVKKRLKALGRWIANEYGASLKVFVDTAPVMEKPFAEKAGVGWQGKHTNLVSQEHGSWLFLGAVFLDFNLPADAAESDHCGTCKRCLEICPTAAFPAPYQLDARRCISYLTIEHKGPIPQEFRASMGNRIYGCDDCLAVCPWNKFAQTADEAAFHARDELKEPALGELANLDDAAFRRLFSGSPIKRSGRSRFLRNVAIAIGNSGDSALAPAVLKLLDDVDPVIRGAAVWAARRLFTEAKIGALRNERLATECDKTVRAEWTDEGGYASTVT